MMLEQKEEAMLLLCWLEIKQISQTKGQVTFIFCFYLYFIVSHNFIVKNKITNII